MKDNIFFRIDDICPGMNENNFTRVTQILEYYKAKPLLGIIPDNIDPKLVVQKSDKETFWDSMKSLENKGYVVAQHGYQHNYCTTGSGLLGYPSKSEFSGLSYDVQYEKLKKGYEMLKEKGLHPKVFMAPSHSFDAATLRALKVVGIQYVTDGLTNKQYTQNGIRFIPCMHTVALRRELNGICTVCLHTNNMKDEDFKRLELFCEKYSKRLSDYATVFSMEYKESSRIKLYEARCAFRLVKTAEGLFGKMRVFKYHIK